MKTDNIKDLQRINLKELDNLKIFKLSLENALINLLKAFEDRSRLFLLSERGGIERFEIAHGLIRQAIDPLQAY